MDADLKAKWVAALRSGAYAQGRHCLLSTDGQRYCCLGVLADLLGEHLTPLPKHRTTDAGDDIYARLPASKVIDLAVEQNDNGRSFAEIADYLEAKLESR